MAEHTVCYFQSRLFIDGHNCRLNKGSVCRCSTSGCPYRVEVSTTSGDSGKRRVLGVVKEVFPLHWHGGPPEEMRARRARIIAERTIIEQKEGGWCELNERREKTGFR